MIGLDLAKLSPDFVDSIVIVGIPLPPSDNHQHKTILRRTNRRRSGFIPMRVPSQGAALYKKQFNDWALLNQQDILRAREAVKEWNCFMELRLHFAMNKERLITLKNTVKKLDVQNRDKAITDLLSDALGVDDRMFNVTLQEKMLADTGKEQVIAILSPSKLRLLSSLELTW